MPTTTKHSGLALLEEKEYILYAFQWTILNQNLTSVWSYNLWRQNHTKYGWFWHTYFFDEGVNPFFRSFLYQNNRANDVWEQLVKSGQKSNKNYQRSTKSKAKNDYKKETNWWENILLKVWNEKNLLLRVKKIRKSISVKISVLNYVGRDCFLNKCTRNFSSKYFYMVLKKNYPPMAIFSA